MANEKGTVRVEVLTRIRIGREVDAEGRPGQAKRVPVGTELDMDIDEAEELERLGAVKIAATTKQRAAAKKAKGHDVANVEDDEVEDAETSAGRGRKK